MSPFRIIFSCLLALGKPALAGPHEKALHMDSIPQAEQCGWGPLTRLRDHDHQTCLLAIDEKVGPHPSDWQPWTHRPYCADTPYCVYTNSMFQGNHSVSIITTPEIAASSPALVLKLSSVGNLRSTAARAETGESPYLVKDIPGKGKGVIATRRIARGEVLMVDYPSVLADVEFPGRVKHDEGVLLLERAMHQLADPDKVLSLARSRRAGTPVPEDVMRTNTFSITLAERSRMALFPEISRMNHACKPNAFTRFAESNLANRVIAFRDIEPGEEIMISYIEAGMTFQERQQNLASRWGFRCTCELCTSPSAEMEASDRRREKVRTTRHEVMEHVQHKDFLPAIKLNEELIELILQEDMVPHLGEHYEVLARLYLAAMDLTNAKKFARMALTALEANGGLEVYDSIRELRALLQWQ